MLVVGSLVGECEGARVGAVEGWLVGETEGLTDGFCVGLVVGWYNLSGRSAPQHERRMLMLWSLHNRGLAANCELVATTSLADMER